MQEKKIRSTWDIFNAVQDAREEAGMQWEEFEENSGIDCNTVLKWGRRKTGCRTETMLRALEAVNLEMVIRPIAKGENVHAEQ